MSLTSHGPRNRGVSCEVCGGRDCTKFTTDDWDGEAPFRPGTREQMIAAAEQAKKAEEAAAPVERARGRRARRPVEDRAHHGSGEDR